MALSVVVVCLLSSHVYTENAEIEPAAAQD